MLANLSIFIALYKGHSRPFGTLGICLESKLVCHLCILFTHTRAGQCLVVLRASERLSGVAGKDRWS